MGQTQEFGEPITRGFSCALCGEFLIDGQPVRDTPKGVVHADCAAGDDVRLHWLKLASDDGPNGPWEIEVHVPIICTLCEQPNGPFVAGQIHTGAPICASCFTKYLVSDEGDEHGS